MEQKTNKIDTIIETAMKNINVLTNADTIVGNPVSMIDGTVIIPVSSVTVGFITGGGEYGEVKMFDKDKEKPFAGGNGAIVNMKPYGFLVSSESGYKLINTPTEPYERLFSSIEDFILSLKHEKN